MQALDPPQPSTRLFWAVVGTCVGVFALGEASLIGRLPADDIMSDAGLVSTLVVEALLAVAWVPILRRRGWSLGCITMPAEILDLARGAWVFAAGYVTYFFAFVLIALAVSMFQVEVPHVPLGGAPSWWVIALVSVMNPIAEEFFYLGFITNVLRSGGLQAALLAGVFARAVLHVYQGPAGVVSAVAFGLVFGLVYLKSNRIWPVVAAHGLTDLIGLALLANRAA